MSILKTLFFRPKTESETTAVKWINIVLVTVIVLGVFHFAFSRLDYPYNWEGIIEKYKYKFMIGFTMTLIISIFSLIASFIIGGLLVLG